MKMEESGKPCFPAFHTLCDIFNHLFACSYMFSTFMSLGDKLRWKLKMKISLCMAIYNAAQHTAILIYTVLPYCVIRLASRERAPH